MKAMCKEAWRERSCYAFPLEDPLKVHETFSVLRLQQSHFISLSCRNPQKKPEASQTCQPFMLECTQEEEEASSSLTLEAEEEPGGLFKFLVSFSVLGFQ